MLLNVSAATVGLSATTEAGIAGELAAAAAAASAALTTVVPMGADLDSIQFAAALNAAGACYVGTASEHAASRGSLAGAQELAASTYAASDVASKSALAL